MINGDVQEFVEWIHYGFDLIFTFRGRKYFMQGYVGDDGKHTTFLDQWEPTREALIWEGKGDEAYPVEEFLAQKLWDGMDFWEAEKEIEWVDE